MFDEKIGEHTGNPFRSAEGWDMYRKLMQLVHNQPTPGQHDAIKARVKEWENKQLAGLEQEAEYHDIMRAQEIFEQLHKEGNDK